MRWGDVVPHRHKHDLRAGGVIQRLGVDFDVVFRVAGQDRWRKSLA
jgi:hypothetical protein